MTDDDFKAAFRSLDPVEPSPTFLQSARSIPLRFPRAAVAETSLWRFFRLPARLTTLAVSAMCGLGVGYLTLDQASAADTELNAFLELDASDDFFATSTDEDWIAP